MGIEVDTFRIQLISIFGSLAAMLAVLELVRRRRLREEYSLVWIAAAIILVFFSIRRDLFESLARALGIDYPPSLLVLGVIIFGLVISIHFSIKISLLEQRVTRLAQELSILRNSTGQQPTIETERTGSLTESGNTQLIEENNVYRGK